MCDENPAHAFYRGALQQINESEIPFLIAGGFALEYYTGIGRDTKDLDLFVRPADIEKVLSVLSAAGYQVEFTFSHWLAKVFSGDNFIDLIFSSGNGICEVDTEWFEHSVAGEVFGMPIRFCPVEEMMWSKAFVMERERYDGSDIAHLIRARGETLDWGRLLRRFGPHWQVFLSHLVLFSFVYPSERWKVPDWIMHELIGRMRKELKHPPPQNRVCRGTLLSRIQYRYDVERLGYRDSRLIPSGSMTKEETSEWTAAGRKK